MNFHDLGASSLFGKWSQESGVREQGEGIKKRGKVNKRYIIEVTDEFLMLCVICIWMAILTHICKIY